MNTSAPVRKGNKEQWIKGLDSIRFVLAFTVFLYHLGNPVHGTWGGSPHLILRGIAGLWGVVFSGVGAVMAFFIISGFVIHYPYRDKMPETRSFLVRRWLRIAIPLLVICPIAGLFHRFSIIPIWSLYCELIYYTLYPLLIRIKGSWFQKFLFSFGLSILLMSVLASDDLSSLIHHRNINYSGAYWQLGNLLTWVIGLPCWLLGVILAQHIDEFKGRVPAVRVWVFRFLALGTGVGVDSLKFHFFVSYLFTMNFFAILLFFWIRNEIGYYRDREPVRILEYSGKFSYSLYLCHNVFIFFIGMIFPLTLATYLPVIVITVLLSWLYYLAVERPGHLLSRAAANLIRPKENLKFR
jgi:peptidoglycan/LPS O-acetylase OafA/YrhL